MVRLPPRSIQGKTFHLTQILATTRPKRKRDRQSQFLPFQPQKMLWFHTFLKQLINTKLYKIKTLSVVDVHPVDTNTEHFILYKAVLQYRCWAPCLIPGPWPCCSWSSSQWRTTLTYFLVNALNWNFTYFFRLLFFFFLVQFQSSWSVMWTQTHKRLCNKEGLLSN